MSGAVGISSDDSVFSLHEGDVAIHRPHALHKLWSEEKTRAHVMIFSFDGSGELLNNLSGAYSCNSELQKSWNSIYHRLKISGKYNECDGYLKYLSENPAVNQEIANLCEINLMLLATKGLPLGYNQSKKALHYKLVVQTMQQNLSNNLTVDELASKCGLSVSSMKGLFKLFNSKGIHEYYMYLKMTEAIRMLESGKTVTETAELLGFSDQSYFSTAFKRIMGDVPARFRNSRS